MMRCARRFPNFSSKAERADLRMWG